jgi:hypothetical protein
MSALVESLGSIKKSASWMAAAGAAFLIAVVLAVPNLKRSAEVRAPHALASEPIQYYTAGVTRAKPEASPVPADALKVSTALQDLAAPVERRIVRTSSLEMLVQHPAEVADKIAALADGMGGYLVTSDGGGQNASAATLTIRVPAARFEEARAAIRKLGLRVETEKIEAQDVTRQYVDQDANLRNLRAEEAGYLAILKQATTVKDLLAVSERLSEVRGQIEQQQAEFNALSRQTETVAITIALRTEAEAQVFGVNWRPAYQLKLALRDGLDSLATYATAMTTILFYLPATLLWVGTIVMAIVIAWKTLRWVGRRWFGWSEAALRG